MQTGWKWTAILAAFLSGAAHAQEPTGPPPALLERNGAVTLKVDNYDTARARVLAQARVAGSVLLTAKTEVNVKGRKHGWIQFRLPTEHLPRLLPQVHTDGKLYAENISSIDNASEHEQLARRIESLQQHQKRLSGVLESPRKMRGSDILYLQERLFRANVDEGLLRQQRVDFEHDAVESTLTVSLFEPGAEPTPPTIRVSLPERFAASRHRAWDGLARQAARGATVAAFALVYAPLWLPALIVVLLLLRWLWVRREVVLTRLGALTLRLIQSLRSAWEARHEPIGFPPRTQA